MPIIAVDTSAACVSYSGVGNAPGFGFVGTNRSWYPISTADLKAIQSGGGGRTYMIALHWDGTNGSSDLMLRQTHQNGSSIFRISYQDTGGASSALWTMRVGHRMASTDFVFNHPLVANEWYWMVIRTLDSADSTTSPPFPSTVAPRVLVNLGRIGTTTNGTATTGPDVFPYGAGGNGGFGGLFNAATTTGGLWRPISAFGGFNSSKTEEVRISWGGAMATSGADPDFTGKWRGGYCEERLKGVVLNDIAVTDTINRFLGLAEWEVYTPFNQTLSSLDTFTSFVSGVYVGFEFPGSAQGIGQGDIAVINHVDPDLDLPTENSTGFPAHPFTQKTIKQVLGQYWVVAPATPILSSGTYRVKLDPEPQLGPMDGQYKVKLDPEQSVAVSGEYNVLIEPQIVASGDYFVLIASGNTFSAELNALAPDHWWTLGETTGPTAADSGSVGTGTGTAQNAVAFAQGDLLGGTETSISIDTTAEAVVGPATPAAAPWQTATTSQSYSVGCFFRISSFSAGSVQYVWSKGVGWARLFINDDGSLSFYRLRESQVTETVTTAAGLISVDTNYFVVCTWCRAGCDPGTGMRIYLDGTEVIAGGTAATQNIPGFRPMVAGRDTPTSGENFDGRIQHVFMFLNRQLNATEITTLWDAVGATTPIQQSVMASGTYRVGPLAATPITAFGAYSVVTDSPQIMANGAYNIDLGPGMIMAEGAYEVSGQPTQAQIQVSGGYRVAIVGDSSLQSLLFRKLAWLRAKTK